MIFYFESYIGSVPQLCRDRLKDATKLCVPQLCRNRLEDTTELFNTILLPIVVQVYEFHGKLKKLKKKKY